MPLANRSRGTWISGAIAFLSLAIAGGACSGFLESGCAGVGYYAVQVQITDEIGDGQALGATVTLTDGSYVEHDSTDDNPTYVRAASDRGGRTYDIVVSKPYYDDVAIRGVRAPGGGCVTGHESSPTTITIPATLHLKPGAPAIRSVRLLPRRVLMDRMRVESYAFSPYVDANQGTSRAVAWSISGDTASVAFDAASGTLTYRCLSKSGYLNIVARSIVDPSVVDSAAIAVQGHPASSSDPPCA